MKILITGANGQLGQELVQYFLSRSEKGLSPNEVMPFSRAEMDITDPAEVQALVQTNKPDVIIHAGAYTKVDQAESDEDRAYAVNAFGTRNVAVAAEKVGAKLVYISTDYVFEGRGQRPYTEFDQPHPLSVYGKSKLAGEEFVKSFSSRFFIVRTSWVYGVYGANFVKTMLKLAEEKPELTVVQDQIGSPTYTRDLAVFLGELIQGELYGVYHATNAGFCSWYEFAQAIFEESGIDVIVNPCTTEEFVRPAPRPAFSVLEHKAIRLNGFKDLRFWREGLKDFLAEYSSMTNRRLEH